MPHRTAIVALGIAILIGGFLITATVSADTGGGTITLTRQQYWKDLTVTAVAREHLPRAPKNPSLVQQPKNCPITYTPGIFPAGIAPGYLMNTYHINNNALLVLSSDVVYQVAAGTLWDTPQQGIILVNQIEVDPCAHSQDYPLLVFRTPGLHGSVTINTILPSGSAISFSTVDGSTGVFDVVLGQFH